MKYRSKPTEIEAMQWHPDCGLQTQDGCAKIIVAWVNANGGEAEHIQSPNGFEDHIAVRTINGWSHAAPGHYVVMGEARFTYQPGEFDGVRDCRDFYPCDPETFERRWEPAS